MNRFGTLLVLMLSTAALAQSGPKISKPFEYSGYSDPVYAGHSTHSTYIPMPDGTRIAVDYFIPTDGPERDAFPVILQYTPYQRSTIDPVTGEINDWGTDGRGQFFLSHGYALAFADMRGTGASTGWLLDFMPELGEDGKEIVDWLAEQPWCDANVGMMGASYLAWSQTATAQHMPEALKCIMPAVVPLEGYTGEVYPGGIYVQGFLKLWSGFMFYSQRSYYDPDNGFLPAKPAIDEDGDGEYHDEIPVDIDASGTFLDDAEVRYPDGNAREDIFRRAIQEHEKNLDYASWAEKSFYIDGKAPLDLTMRDMSPNAFVPKIMESGIPIYHVGGWFDGFARGSFELYSTMRETNPSKLIMFPGYHNVVGGPYYEHLGESAGEHGKRLLVEHLRFFDRYLKDIENGIDEEEYIFFYTMHGQGWRSASEWPLAAQQLTSFNLAPGGALNWGPGIAGAEEYTVDFTHNSSYGENQANRWLGIGGMTPNGLPIRTEKDKQCLTYTTAQLGTDVEVTGHPRVDLWVSSTADYGDFFVYLVDVDENGESVLVTEAQLRAGFAALKNSDEIIANADIDVKPDLPWHGYAESDYQDAPLADGNVVELTIDFLPTSWVFKAGHSIRIAIAGADFPTYRLHPKLSPANDPADPGNITPTVTVHHTAAHPSRLVLPVIPD